MHIFKLLLERINAFFAKHSNILGIRSKTFFNISIINTNELVTGVLHYHQLCKIYCVTSVGKIAASYGYNYVEGYIDVFVVYIIVCTLAQIGFQLCERHFGRYRQSTQSVGK